MVKLVQKIAILDFGKLGLYCAELELHTSVFGIPLYSGCPNFSTEVSVLNPIIRLMYEIWKFQNLTVLGRLKPRQIQILDTYVP